jgi:hypothetical protein
MNHHDSANRIASGARNIRVSFPPKAVVFLDVVVRQYDRSTSGMHHGRARLDGLPQ